MINLFGRPNNRRIFDEISKVSTLVDIDQSLHRFEGRIVSAISNLGQSIVGLQSTVDVVVAKLGDTSNNDTAIQQAADAVAAATAALNAAVQPPAQAPVDSGAPTVETETLPPLS